MDISTINQFFQEGMKRTIPELLTPPDHSGLRKIQLGGGKHLLEGWTNLDLPEWNGDADQIPAEDGSVSEIRAFHFLEHLQYPVRCILEIQRVLCVGGVANLLVPHCLSALSFADFTHYHHYSEDIWKHLFKNSHYFPAGQTGWTLKPHFNIIIGVTQHNLALATQLVKL